jgi:hypothetical protein
LGPKRNAYRILVKKPEGRRHLGRQRCRWVNNIKMDLREDGVVWTRLIWLRIGPLDGCCKHGNETSGSIEYGEVIEYLHKCQLLEKSSTP